MIKNKLTNFIRIRVGEIIHEYVFNSRDWKVLYHVENKYRRYYSEILAVHDVNGRSYITEVERDRLDVLAAVKDLLVMIKIEESLLEYDYSFFIPKHLDFEEQWSYGSISGFRVKGNFLTIWVKPGQCWIEESRVGANGMEEIVKVTDWRECKPLMLDAGVEIKFARRKKGLSWPIVFPPLIEFLESRQEETIYVLNKHR